MSTELPKGWAWSTVGDIGLYQNGRAFSDREWGTEGRQIIRIQNLTGTNSHFNHFDGEVEERHLVREGDLLISWAATLGVYVWRGKEAALNQHIFKVLPYVEKSYLRYALTWALEAMRLQSHGSGMVHITKGKFESVPIPVAPESEQQRIVDELESRLSHLEAANSSLATARLLVASARSSVLAAATSGTLTPATSERGSSYLAEILSAKERLKAQVRRQRNWTSTDVAEPVETPEHWECVRLGDLAWTSGYGTSVKCSPEQTGVPVLRIPNVLAREVSLNDLKFAPADSELDDLLVAPGDVLFIRSNGSLSVVGRAAPVRPGVVASFASYLIRARFSDELLASWVALVATAPAGRTQLTAAAASTAGQHNLGLNDIANLVIPLPPRDELKAIISEVDRRFSLLASAERSIAGSLVRAEQLRRSLLEAAFSGQLVPQDPDDEPADDLLERIRDERAAIAPQKKTRTKRKETVA